MTFFFCAIARLTLLLAYRTCIPKLAYSHPARTLAPDAATALGPTSRNHSRRYPSRQPKIGAPAMLANNKHLAATTRCYAAHHRIVLDCEKRPTALLQGYSRSRRADRTANRRSLFVSTTAWEDHNTNFTRNEGPGADVSAETLISKANSRPRPRELRQKMS